MTPSSDGLLSSILNDDDLQLMDPSAMGADGKNAETPFMVFIRTLSYN